MYVSRAHAALMLLVAAVVGCGGATPEGGTPGGATGADDGASSGSSDSGSERMAASAEVGALDKGAVQAIVNKTMSQVTTCLDDGRKKLSFLGGEAKIFLRINQSGKADQGYYLSSTLGDHEVEACIMKAFTNKQWPRPQGGEAGEISQAFDFSGVESPTEWSASELETKMEGDFAELKSKLVACREEANAGSLQVTMYLDEDGMARTMGLASGDENGIKALSCVELTLQTTSFPSPGDNYAKVTLSVD